MAMAAGAGIRLEDLARQIGATILTPGRPGAVVDRIYAGDRISDLLDQASDRTLLVTNLVGGQLMRVAELMDVPGICLVNGHAPDADTLSRAADHDTLLMVSSAGMFETCGRIYQYLAEERQGGP